MGTKPIITGITVTEFELQLHELGTDYNGFNLVYVPGSTVDAHQRRVQMHTDLGITGEVQWRHQRWPRCPCFADYLIGKNALERERIYQDVKRALRQAARMGMARSRRGPVGYRRQVLQRPDLRAAGRAHHARSSATPPPPTATTTAACPRPRPMPTLPSSAWSYGLPGLQDSRLGQLAGRPGDRQHPRGGQARRRQDGPDARPGLRARTPLPTPSRWGAPATTSASSGWRTPTRMAASRSSPIASCARSSARRSCRPSTCARWSRTSTLPWPTPPISCAAISATTASPA